MKHSGCAPCCRRCEPCASFVWASLSSVLGRSVRRSGRILSAAWVAESFDCTTAPRCTRCQFGAQDTYYCTAGLLRGMQPKTGSSDFRVRVRLAQVMPSSSCDIYRDQRQPTHPFTIFQCTRARDHIESILPGRRMSHTALLPLLAVRCWCCC